VLAAWPYSSSGLIESEASGILDGTRMRNGGSHRPIIDVVRRLRGTDNSKRLLHLSRAQELRVVVPDPSNMNFQVRLGGNTIVKI
jgi:hypothetical protein